VPRPLSAAQGKRLAQLASVFSRRSFQLAAQKSREMQQRLDQLAQTEPADVILIESSLMVGFRLDPRAAVVIVEHDIVFELLLRMCQTERSPVRRLYNRIEYSKLKREEVAAWHGATGVVVTSTRELPVVQQLAPGTPVHVAPNGVDVEYFSPSTELVDTKAIVMTGFMKTRPNIDGALFFVREILPRVLDRRPDAVFYLVGASPPDEVRRLAGAHVIVTGEVPDVRPYVRRAAVVVVPLRMGGGTRLKILEGLAMEKPIVTTSLGCEGIDVANGEHLFVADGAEAFASAVVRVMSDLPGAQVSALRGRALVQEQYHWEGIADRLEVFLRELVVRQQKGEQR
jgi:glycosyltransferase involved in cell wall biosynthesis